MKKKIINFYGIKFYNHDFKKLIGILDNGGYLVAPAASALSSIKMNTKYLEALQKSSVAILDSGFFCILLKIFKKKIVNKYSGYLFLKTFINYLPIKKKKLLLVDPNYLESKENLLYLKKKNFNNIKSYIAPIYRKKIEDYKLLKIINSYKPKYVIINIGGETQEILALFLNKNLNRNTSIICTGAAIAFLTKRQAPINDFVDKYYLGWFVRLIYNPRVYFSRILNSLKLIKLFF